MYLPVEPGRLIEGPVNRGCTVICYFRRFTFFFSNRIFSQHPQLRKMIARRFKHPGDVQEALSLVSNVSAFSSLSRFCELSPHNFPISIPIFNVTDIQCC